MRGNPAGEAFLDGLPAAPLLDALPDPVILLDQHRVVRAWNAAAQALLGSAAAEALGRPLDALPLPQCETWLDVLATSEQTDGACSVAAALPDERGEAVGRAIDLSAAPLRGPAGERIGTVLIAHDITEPVLACVRSARRAEEMARQVVHRDLFFSAMSHDLRTPITAVMGYSELLADGVIGDLTERQHEMVERIFHVAGHLSDLLNDVLDLAKLDAGRMEFAPEQLELDALVHDAALDIEPQAHAKGLRLTLQLEAATGRHVYADPKRTRQILVNLLGNAVKFTERGEVRVTVSAGERHASISVRDTGPGLPPGQEEAVFEEFVKMASGSGSKTTPGSGLGLAISRRLARAMGGDLVAHSTPGAGATFVLTLPLC